MEEQCEKVNEKYRIMKEKYAMMQSKVQEAKKSNEELDLSFE